jgi:very long chain acyl-CoA dehydrogenase
MAATAAAPVASELKGSKEHEKAKQQRPASTKVNKKARTSDSFVLNLFRGQFYPNEVFPYPNVLNEEQRENVKMLIDPIWKFFEEKNDAAKNDQLEKVIRCFCFVMTSSFVFRSQMM